MSSGIPYENSAHLYDLMYGCPCRRTQDLGLFGPEEMNDAFAAVGLEADYRENDVWNRGLYVARRD